MKTDRVLIHSSLLMYFIILL